MRVNRKGAWFLLAIMLLSAALPSLACLATARHSACCQQMMDNCGSSMTMADSCCKMRATDTNMPPALASQPESNGVLAHVVAPAILMPAAVNDSAFAPSGETPPASPPPSGRSSILRI